MKPVTCGVVFIQGNKILLGHSTGNKHWDIQKGLHEPGEEYIETAVRETFEEIGTTVDPRQLKFIGLFPYNKQKDICIFLCNEVVDLASFSCTSYFTDQNGKSYPEIDNLIYVDFDIGLTMTGKAMSKLLASQRHILLQNNIDKK